MRHYGLTEPNVHFHNVLQEVNDAVFERSDQLSQHLRRVIQQRPEHFRFIKGSASLLSETEIEVKTDSGNHSVFADNIIIATGSRPRKLDSIPFDENVIMTSDGISSLKEFPESLVILGVWGYRLRICHHLFQLWKNKCSPYFQRRTYSSL